MSLICFDLDGVLVDTTDMHYRAFNMALEVHGYDTITHADHMARFNGIPTRMKLQILSTERSMSASDRAAIWNYKQDSMPAFANVIRPDPVKRFMLDQLAADGHTLACVSNSRKHTVQTLLMCAAIYDCFDVIVTADDVTYAKPSPEPYVVAMETAEFGISDTWIVEDSDFGLVSAKASRARVIPVSGPDAVRYGTIAPHLWTVLIPMAGAGKRFAAAGYKDPKPLIDVNGRPMIDRVVENLGLPGPHYFIGQAGWSRGFNLRHPQDTYFVCPKPTDGAARTALLLSSYLDNDQPLLIANADQLIDGWDPAEFAEATCGWDGLIPTFECPEREWRWSYAETDTEGRVRRVAEKDPISTHATCGIYWWRRGSDFVKAAKTMIGRNDRTNGEFYIAPTYNYSDDATAIHPVRGMHGLGTPEDLETYLGKS